MSSTKALAITSFGIGLGLLVAHPICAAYALWNDDFDDDEEPCTHCKTRDVAKSRVQTRICQASAGVFAGLTFIGLGAALKAAAATN